MRKCLNQVLRHRGLEKRKRRQDIHRSSCNYNRVEPHKLLQDSKACGEAQRGAKGAHVKGRKTGMGRQQKGAPSPQDTANSLEWENPGEPKGRCLGDLSKQGPESLEASGGKWEVTEAAVRTEGEETHSRPAHPPSPGLPVCSSR